MVRLSLALALVFLCSPASAEPIYGQFYAPPSQYLRTCKSDVAKAVAQQKKADPSGPRTRAVERMPGQMDAIRNSCAAWYRCQEDCHKKIHADCKALKGKAKRQCKKARRKCKRKKCGQQTEQQACISARNTFWNGLDQNLWNLWKGKPGKSLDARAKAAKAAALSCGQVFPSTVQARVKNVSKYR